ncbi:YdeI/OmpD-associated family protein [Ponticoccus sp. SC2-23]|uniref:YdeI/OmpD-associated family protein n=1 Tax=Alexandriicola marinus TaxID=2081710 RepID=UPI00193C1ECD|nr:YdeI/OmpD-associated family protein [Alexandriicola marinus]MBM1222166.1 YdeI/OmpD-associated family protein [Ponticoccus sp. SC6-9]MBM1226853.1 YdeI/OmpD-associated family protein [Ponticoccus sp. SC6-15]MBM1231113.1 YdeI/OmpD-associated family protein [Ponticoccus sp. SC6-38]MBM1235635.1 YdeI/OmpD-associated family protein [Ponticoccus sp. SC6-45]MBM1240135.1 YdeI/OmpD-associated family protein [Ponticoccus sp. SC6-49]MBM1244489.1 YdeI/OmpD-associated family protein [Ponticoccus sp. SC2-
MAMITEIEDYFARGCGRCDRFDTSDCSARIWQPGLSLLRAICREAGLSEHVKWGHPCYMHADRNIAIIGAFRGDFRLNFFNAGLMKDPEGVLERQGPNTQTPGMISFSSNDGPARLADTIKAYLEEAKSYAEAGITAPKPSQSIELPEELLEALDSDPELAEAFHALTPGRQKSYAINLNGAKKTQTRIARIEKFRPKILAGKGATEL